MWSPEPGGEQRRNRARLFREDPGMPENTAARLDPSGSRPRVSVVIPTYNAARNLPHVFRLLPGDVHEVIGVAGNSVDGSVEVGRRSLAAIGATLQYWLGTGTSGAWGCA